VTLPHCRAEIQPLIRINILAMGHAYEVLPFGLAAPGMNSEQSDFPHAAPIGPRRMLRSLTAFHKNGDPAGLNDHAADELTA
jgi:hypothetical protein